ncbi:MAG: hypothetical protein ACPG31_09690 [Planctomycetota bacterium]
MTDAVLRCPKCPGEMDSGFLFDREAGALLDFVELYAGLGQDS